MQEKEKIAKKGMEPFRRGMKRLVTGVPIGYTSCMKHLLLCLTFACLFLGVPARTAACPSCREAIAAAEDKNGTPGDGFGLQGEAISSSVLFMLAMPFVLAAGFGLAFYRLSRPPAVLPPVQTASLPVPEAMSS